MVNKKRVLTSEEVREFKQAMASVDWTRDPAARRAIAETIVKDVRQDVEQDDLIRLMGVDVQYFDEGQSVQFRTRRGMKAYVHAPGSLAPRSTMTTNTVVLTTELTSVHPELEIGQLTSGRYGSIQDIRNEAKSELLGSQYATIWNTLIASVPSSQAGTNYWTYASTVTAAAQKNALDSGFNYVADVAGSEITAIVGRRSALGFLQDYSAYTTHAPSDKLRSELESNPFVGSYRGVPVIMLNQYTDGYGVNRITNGNIMILGKDTIKMGVDRPVGVEETIDVDTLNWHMHIYTKFGTAVVLPTRNARIYIS